MPQPSGSDTRYEKYHQADSQAQPDTEGVKGSSLRLVSLVQHQKVESAPQAGDQSQYQYQYRSF